VIYSGRCSSRFQVATLDDSNNNNEDMKEPGVDEGEDIGGDRTRGVQEEDYEEINSPASSVVSVSCFNRSNL
jgi:hypothetical protein